jgi:hypothetical protein
MKYTDNKAKVDAMREAPPLGRPYMGRLKSSADSCLRRFNFALNPAGLILRSQHVPAQSIGSILWFDPRREHSSVPTAKSLGRRAQGLSRLAASFAATRRAWP